MNLQVFSLSLALFAAATLPVSASWPNYDGFVTKDEDGNVVIDGRRAGDKQIKLRIAPPAGNDTDYYSVDELLSFLQMRKWDDSICAELAKSPCPQSVCGKMAYTLSEPLTGSELITRYHNLSCGTVLDIVVGQGPRLPLIRLCPYTQPECQLLKKMSAARGFYLPTVEIGPHLQSDKKLQEMLKQDVEPLFYAMFQIESGKACPDDSGVTLCYEPFEAGRSEPATYTTPATRLRSLHKSVTEEKCKGMSHLRAAVDETGFHIVDANGYSSRLTIPEGGSILVPFGNGRHLKNIYTSDPIREVFVQSNLTLTASLNTSVRSDGGMVGIKAYTDGGCSMRVTLVGKRIQNCHKQNIPIFSCPNTFGIDVLTCKTKVTIGTVHVQGEESGDSNTKTDTQTAKDHTSSKVHAGASMEAGASFGFASVNVKADIYGEHEWGEDREHTESAETSRYFKRMSSLTEAKSIEVEYTLLTQPGMYQVLFQEHYTCRGRTEATPLMKVETYKYGKDYAKGVGGAICADSLKPDADVSATAASDDTAAAAAQVCTRREENIIEPIFEQEETFLQCCRGVSEMLGAEKFCSYRELLEVRFDANYPALERGVQIAPAGSNETALNEVWAKFLHCLNNGTDNRECCYASPNSRGAMFKKDCTPLCNGNVLAGELDIRGVLNVLDCSHHLETAVLCAVQDEKNKKRDG